jgi:hypothetical protein
LPDGAALAGEAQVEVQVTREQRAEHKPDSAGARNDEQISRLKMCLIRSPTIPEKTPTQSNCEHPWLWTQPTELGRGAPARCQSSPKPPCHTSGRDSTR